MIATPADHGFYFDPNKCACGERKECDHSCMPDVIDGFCSHCGEPTTCEHIPMKAALDDKIGCIKCGKWLGAAQ